MADLAALLEATAAEYEAGEEEKITARQLLMTRAQNQGVFEALCQI
jgi:hypothetical protein